jgi:hypothetical protein
MVTDKARLITTYVKWCGGKNNEIIWTCGIKGEPE